MAYLKFPKGVHVGCSGFSYLEWRGVFYPQRLPKEEWLEYYKRFFSVVELNFTFYRFPSQNVIGSMVLRAPKLKFSLKAHRKFTHERNYTTADVDHFLKGITPLVERGNLIAVLFQFPESFGMTDQHWDYLERLHTDFAEVPQAFELRNKSWINREFLRWMEERNIILVNIDAPKELGWPIGPWVSVGEFNYVRLHGRNPKKLYDYFYSEEELEELVKKLKKIHQGKYTYVFFNNTVRAQCVANAIKLKMLLGVWNPNIPVPNSIKRMWLPRGEFE
jgi:uncharacterized protein YecE (DUF72 family)